MSAKCHKRTLKGLRCNPINQRWIVIRRVSSAQATRLFDGAAGYTGDEAVKEQIIGDRHRDASDQCAGHDLAPVEDVAADEIGRHAEGDRFLVRRGNAMDVVAYGGRRESQSGCHIVRGKIDVS